MYVLKHGIGRERSGCPDGRRYCQAARPTIMAGFLIDLLSDDYKNLNI
jgi:hypothetical protein